MNKDQLQSLEKIISYKFKQQDLLELALTHRSFKGSNNERLEFLGDSILNFISNAIYNIALCSQPASCPYKRIKMLRLKFQINT